MHQTKHIDSRRQVKWIASAVTERRSSQCCWMRNMCVTCKLNLFPGKYLKLLAEIVFTIKGLRRKRQRKTVGSSLDLFFSSYAPCVRIATTVVVWDKRWPLSKYLWIYSIVVPPPPPPSRVRGVAVWIRARQRYWCSYLRNRGGDQNPGA